MLSLDRRKLKMYYYRNGNNQTIEVNQPSTSVHQSGSNPIAPPRARRSSSHNSLFHADFTTDIQAANAISGGVQASQDLPYMTPPLLITLPHLPESTHNNHFSGDSQDSSWYCLKNKDYDIKIKLSFDFRRRLHQHQREGTLSQYHGSIHNNFPTASTYSHNHRPSLRNCFR